MCRPWRFTLPCTFATRTSCTFTPKRVSTAFLISGLVASRCTSKPRVRWVSLRLVIFSVTSGRRMTSYMFFMEFLGLRCQPLLELGERFLGDEQVAAVQHVVDVHLGGVDHLQSGDVATGEDQVVGRLVVDEQRLARHLQLAQDRDQVASLGLREV